MAEAALKPEKNVWFKTDDWTRQELEFVTACRQKAVHNFQLGAFLGASLTWMATKRLSNLLRISLSGGAAASYGLSRFRGSLYTSVDRCLSLDGSLVQKQLANMILHNFRNNPWLMQLITKHFYLETVFDDSSSDQPQTRWRYRNHFDDSVAHGQITQGNSSVDSDNGKPDPRLKQVPVSPAIDIMADPLDCVLGYSGIEIIQNPEPSSSSPKVVTRRHKRSHLRRRGCRHEVSSDPPSNA